MKIIKSTLRPDGTTRMIIELAQGEIVHPAARNQPVLKIDEAAHYSLGEPMREDIIAGHILAGATRVHWCSITQKWID